MLFLDLHINQFGRKEDGHVSCYCMLVNSDGGVMTRSALLVFTATTLTLVNIFSTKATMKMMGFLTIVKLSVLGLIAFIGLLVLVRIMPSEVDAGLNLSFYGTSNTVGPYASALYYVGF